MKCYAVIDTNVLVSALLTKNIDSPTIGVVQAIADRVVVPVFSEAILQEYEEVLHRRKFHFTGEKINMLMGILRYFGITVSPESVGDVLPDPKDIPFYEVTMEMRDDGAYLVTGNKKHFPMRPYIVNAREFMDIINSK